MDTRLSFPPELSPQHILSFVTLTSEATSCHTSHIPGLIVPLCQRPFQGQTPLGHLRVCARRCGTENCACAP